MTIRTACITAGAAALALPAFAGSPKNITPQLAAPGRFVQPDRAASAMLLNGRLVLTSDWIDLGATTRNPPDTYAHDAFEDDGTGFPSDNTPGCTGSGVPVGSRWYLGGTYNNPFASNDMTTDAAGAGALCEGLNLAWWWNIDEATAPYDDTDGNGELDQDCIIAIFSTDTMAADCTDDGIGTAFPGVIYTFASLNDGQSSLGQGYYFTNIDLTGSGLSHEMPADGAGGYIWIVGSSVDGAGVITLTGGAGDIYSQPMLWGTGEDEVPTPQIRVGTQDLVQYDDDAPTDGVHDLAFECYDYTFGVCPNPLGICLGFRYKSGGGGCQCPGDLNGDGLRDISDLALFLSQFGSTDGGCDDINGDGVTDISDLALILSTFGSPC